MSSAQFSRSENLDHLPLALVVGGAGFLGSFLCEALLEKNLKVICLDNLTTGKKDNLLNCLKNPAFTFLENDINNVSLNGKFKPEYIFHLAGVEEYINGLDVSLETLLVNSLGTKNILDLVKETNSKFLLVSSLSVYEGVLSGTSLKDDFGIDKKDMQKYTHHEAKRFSEALTAEYYRKFSLNSRVVRIMDCYGPRMSPEEGSPINKLFKQFLENESLSIEGEGLELLRPTYVSDLVSGILKAMFYQETSGKIYSLVVPQEITLVNFAYALQKASGKNLKIEFLPSSGDLKFPKKIIGIDKTAKELNWQPEISLSEGIDKTLAYFLQKNEIKESVKTGVENNLPAASPVGIVSKPVFVTEVLDSTVLPEKPVTSPETGPEIKAGENDPLALNILPQDRPSEVKNIQPLEESVLTSKEPAVQTAPVIPPSLIKYPVVNKTSPAAADGQVLLKNKTPGQRKKSRSLLRNLFLFFSLVIILFMVMFPVLRLGFLTYTGSNYLHSAKALLGSGDFVSAAQNSLSARNGFSQAQEDLNSLSWISTIFRYRRFEADLNDNLEIGEKLAEVLNHASVIGKSAQSISSDLNSGSASIDDTKLADLRLELKAIDERLAIVQALNNQKKFNCLFFQDKCAELEKQIAVIPGLRRLLFKADKLVASLPEILGSAKEQKYLFLFQNNMELRGGGGFIGSYGLLTIKSGRLLTLKIDDIYSIDGQLKGHVTPPDEILHFLGQNDYYLRDSNTSADFSLNSKRAAWFFEKETGYLVDGVIALDLSAVEKILAVTGPLTLTDYDKEITSKNLFLEAETQAEANFFPGSTQKKDFLAKLGKALLAKLPVLSAEKIPLLLSAVNSSLDEKHLQAFSFNQNLETALLAVNSGGGLETNSCLPKTNCVNDQVLVLDNNFGANKVNYFLDRKIARTTTIGKEGEVREKLVVNYKNNSPAETWPGGQYKNMIKIYAPSGSRLLAFNIGDDRKATVSGILREDIIKKVKPGEFLVYESSESGRTTWTSEVLVPVGSQKTVSLDFELPVKLNFREIAQLEATAEKQAGTEEDPLDWKVAFPAFVTPSAVLSDSGLPGSGKQLLVNAQVISYNTNLSVDRKLDLEFKKN